MSCGLPDVPERVNQVVEERKRVTRRMEDLELELAKSVASSLVAEMREYFVTRPNANRYLKHYHRTDDPTNALAFLQSLSSTTLSAVSATAGLSGKQFLFVFSSSPVSQTSNSVSSILLLSSDEKLVKGTGDLLKQKLAVRGGGKGVRWSGKWTGVWKENRENEIVDGILQEIQSYEI